MKIDISALSMIAIVASTIALLIATVRSIFIGASSFRSHWFFKGRLSDLTMAEEYLKDRRRDAFGVMKDERVFYFLFGFGGSSKLRDAVYAEITAGTFTERQVRTCGWLFELNEGNAVIVRARHRAEAIERVVFTIFTVVPLLFSLLLIVAVVREKQVPLSLLVAVLLVSILMCLLALRSVSELINIRTIKRLRDKLAETIRKNE